jgi:hypothetical protein
MVLASPVVLVLAELAVVVVFVGQREEALPFAVVVLVVPLVGATVSVVRSPWAVPVPA